MKNIVKFTLISLIIFNFIGCVNSRGFDNETKINKVTNSKYDKEGFDYNGVNEKTKTLYDEEGYNLNGYDKNGFNYDGINKKTKTLYDEEGYDKDRYDRFGYDEEGYDKKGYNRAGEDKEGYGEEGYDRFGYDIIGLDREGYNRAGYNKEGYNKKGYDKEGYNKKGYDKEGYNRAGYDIVGLDKEGYNRAGYNYSGYDREGYDEKGFNEHYINKETQTIYDKNGRNYLGYKRKKMDIIKRSSIISVNINKFDSLDPSFLSITITNKTASVIKINLNESSIANAQIFYQGRYVDKGKLQPPIILGPNAKKSIDITSSDNLYYDDGWYVSDLPLAYKCLFKAESQNKTDYIASDYIIFNIN